MKKFSLSLSTITRVSVVLWITVCSMLPKNAKCQTLSDSTGWIEVLDSAFYLVNSQPQDQKTLIVQ